MRLISILLIFLLNPCLTQAHIKIGAYKGFYKINNELTSRLYKDNKKFSLATALNNTELNQFFGDYITSPTGTVFSNRDPNGINYSLYYIAFNKLASDLSKICLKEFKSFKKSVVDTISTFCNKNLKTLSPSSFQDLWYLLMGFEAPKSEYKAFYNFFRFKYKATSNIQLIKNLGLSIFLNPHFLLEK